MRLTVKYDNEWFLVITKEWIKEDLQWSDYCKNIPFPNSPKLMGLWTIL